MSGVEWVGEWVSGVEWVSEGMSELVSGVE